MQQIRAVRDLGLAVKGARQDRGLSQAALSTQVGVSRKWLSEFEQGKGAVDLSLVLRVLGALDMPLAVGAPSQSTEVNVHDSAHRHVSTQPDLDELLDGYAEDGP